MRVPTYIDAETNRLAEIPEGDFLSTAGSGIAEGHVDLTGDNVVADMSAGGSFSLTLSANTAFSFINAPDSGNCGFTVSVTQDAGASGFTLTWPSRVNWAGGSAPDLTPDADKTDVFVFTTTDKGESYIGMVSGKGI